MRPPVAECLSSYMHKKWRLAGTEDWRIPNHLSHVILCCLLRKKEVLELVLFWPPYVPTLQKGILRCGNLNRAANAERKPSLKWIYDRHLFTIQWRATALSSVTCGLFNALLWELLRDGGTPNVESGEVPIIDGVYRNSYLQSYGESCRFDSSSSPASTV